MGSEKNKQQEGKNIVGKKLVNQQLFQLNNHLVQKHNGIDELMKEQFPMEIEVISNTKKNNFLDIYQLSLKSQKARNQALNEEEDEDEDL